MQQVTVFVAAVGLQPQDNIFTVDVCRSRVEVMASPCPNMNQRRRGESYGVYVCKILLEYISVR